jgi:hypothetical protein
MLTSFIVVSFLVFAFFAYIWKANTGFNATIKFMFIMMTLWSCTILVQILPKVEMPTTALRLL